MENYERIGEEGLQVPAAASWAMVGYAVFRVGARRAMRPSKVQ